MKLTPAFPPSSTSLEPSVAMQSIPQSPRSAQALSGALALIPGVETPGSEKLLSGFRAVLVKQGPTAAVQWLVRQSAALQAVVGTPAGRGALAAVIVGAAIGWTAGSNARKMQAVATALKAIADQHLPADQTARQVGQVLREAMFGRQRVATPTRGDTSTAWSTPTHPDTLAEARVKLVRAKQRLTESKELLRQSPRDPDLPKIIQAQSVAVTQLQAKVNTLERAQAPGAGSSTSGSPQKVPVVPPLPVLTRTTPVVPVEKLPQGKPPQKTNPLIDTKRRITRPPSPTVPAEFDRSEVGKQKVLDRAGEVTRRQRVDRFQKGGSRKDALDGLTGNLGKQVDADIDAIDRGRLPPGGATGGRIAEPTASSPDGNKPTDSTKTNANTSGTPDSSGRQPGSTQQSSAAVNDPKVRQQNFDVWFGRGKPTPQKGFMRTEAQRQHRTDGTTISQELKELMALEGQQPYANSNLQGPPSEFVVEGTKPRVLYHGTNKKFHAFDRSQTHDAGWLGTGYYFTSDRELAITYARSRSQSPSVPVEERGQQVVVNVHLALRKPYVISDEQFYSGKLQAGSFSAELTRTLKQQGFDGVIFKNGDRIEYCIFSAPQIKSAQDNRGTYSPTNPDMRSKLAEKLPKIA